MVMTDSPQERVLLARPCHYSLPDDLRFSGLARPRGTEIVRIRFSRGHATTLDIPVSAETLVELAHALTPLYGSVPEEVKENLADLQKKGLQLLK
jgi:hypothetical protein